MKKIAGSIQELRIDTETSSGERAGVAQLVEHQPSKLRVAGSIPVSRSIISECYLGLFVRYRWPACLTLVTGFSFLFGPRSSVGGALPW